MLDALIIGGGPAGATAGRLLAEWGYEVAIVTAPAGRRPSMAECLPPSNRKLWQFLGILDAIDGAGFYRTTGNTVWWNSETRIEPYPEGWGYQVVRRDFDALLLTLARTAGARVRIGKASAAIVHDLPVVTFRGEPVEARFLVDCSGRSGVLARLFHVKQEISPPKTVAMLGIWSSETGFSVPDETHTLVESYEGGWAWSVPVSSSVRHLGVVTTPGAKYHDELNKTRELRRIFADARLEAGPWGRDATVARAALFSGPGFVIAGDAASTIDPLSSFGVKKAMASGWLAAVVANTWLRHPGMRDAALEFFAERETEVYQNLLAQSAAWHGEAAPESLVPPLARKLEIRGRELVQTGV